MRGCCPRASVSLGFQQQPAVCHVSNRCRDEVPVGSVCGGEPQSRWQQGNKFGAAMGIVLETVQPVDGGRWEKPGLDLFPVLLFFACFYFQLRYLWAILSCLLLHPHPYFFFLSSHPSFLFPLLFLLILYLNSWRVTRSVCLLTNLFPVPLSLPP